MLIESDHKNGGVFGEHPPTPKHLPGIEAATGSLGHGFPMGVGMSLASKIRNEKFNVFAVLGDGECNEGSIWEAAMFAAANQLENICVIIDSNKWQATGRSEEVLTSHPLADKWRAFGWDTDEVDGHNLSALKQAITKKVSPRAIIAHTVR